jgi:hypothetical protein
LCPGKGRNLFAGIADEISVNERKKERKRVWAAANPGKVMAAKRAYREANREKIKAKSQAYRAANREKLNARSRAYTAAHPSRQLATQRAYKYGLSADAFEALRAAQQNKCAICRMEFSSEPRQTHVDHDHATGKVRALLCEPCNHGLGNFKESETTLLAAVEYLQKYRLTSAPDGRE